MREGNRVQAADVDESFFGGELDNDLAPLLAAAHELKTPLAVVGYMASALKSSELTEHQRAQYVDRIILSTERMSRLVEDFTRAYRLGDEKQAELFGLEPVNIAHTAEDVISSLLPLAQQLECRFELKISARLPLAVANHQLLGNVLMNLCDNALKHAPRGSSVRLTLSQAGGNIRSLVSDQGAEVSRQELLRLRSKLGRELQPLSGRPHSSGLGLYIANQLTKAMGGRLGSICHHKTGATFYVDLQRSYQTSLL